jgi:agmatine deiminase
VIPDNQTTFLYLADTLPKKQPTIYRRFEKVLKGCNVQFTFLQGTKDVWAVDYMPILQLLAAEYVMVSFSYPL